MHKGKVAAVCFVVLILLSACTVKTEPDTVTVQLKWVHQAQFAGFYVAEQMGFFAEENLDVEFLEGGSNINPIDTVTSGVADFAVSAPEELVIAVSRGEDLKAIANIFQISPVVFVSMADSGITRPQDFIGKSVAVLGELDFEIQLHIMLDFLNISLDDLTLRQHTYGADELTGGEVDVQAFYATGGLLRLRNEGYQVNLIYPGDFGVHLNGDCIITADATLAENPDLTLRFLRALVKGWQHAVEHEDQAVEATMRYALESDVVLQREMLTASIPLISTGREKIGSLDTQSWQTLHDALLDQGLITRSIPLEEVIDPSYVERIYSE